MMTYYVKVDFVDEEFSLVVVVDLSGGSVGVGGC